MIYGDLLPGTHYQYRFDPYWVSAFPYRVDLANQETQTVRINVRNFHDRPQRHHIVLETPPGIVAEPAVLRGTVKGKSRQTYPVTVSVQADQLDAHANGFRDGVGMVTMDITLDDQRYGQWFDFLVRTEASEAETPAATGSRAGRE